MLRTMARQWAVNWVNANYYFADVPLSGKVNSFKGVRRKYIGFSGSNLAEDDGFSSLIKICSTISFTEKAS
jgi:hypothetical protein